LKVQLPAGYRTPKVRVTTTKPVIQSSPVDLRPRRDLKKIVAKARQMASEGSGKRPGYLAPVPRDPTARRQYSFSRLTGTLHVHAPTAGAELSDSDVRAEPPLDPRGLGTLVHAVLAEIDSSVSSGNSPRPLAGEPPLNSPRPLAGEGQGVRAVSTGMASKPEGITKPSDAAAWVHRRAAQHVPDAKPQDLDEPIEMLQRFLASPRAAEIASAKEVHRELEFLLSWPPDDSRSGGRYLQGFIDCLYCDAAGRWHVVDYKTNRVARERLSAAAEEYEMQMLVYALAAEQILKRPPVEVALCFLRPGLEHRFLWDDAARRRVVELVNQALPNEW
jgi:ATP-dependent helicase/nuclease subunit A